MAKRPFAEVTTSTPFRPSSGLEKQILQLFMKLHSDQTNHDIFGEPAKGVLRLPLYSSRANGQSWANFARKIASWVSSEMGSNFDPNGCWMSKSTQLQITATVNNKVIVYKQITVVRLLAFIANPTPIHWDYLTETGTRWIDTPFSHSCNRGLKRDDGQIAFCINGLHHGRFATRLENESHKLCTNGARPLCTGHGSPPVKCIFTHPDGSLKPCLNHGDMVPKCTSQRRCF